jgi:hypothetical protein
LHQQIVNFLAVHGNQPWSVDDQSHAAVFVPKQSDFNFVTDFE